MIVNFIKYDDCNQAKLMSSIVSAVYRAVSEDIINDLQRAEIGKSNSNSYYQRVWDYINRNICNIDLDFIVTGFTSRGPWNIAVLFDKLTGTVYTIMREKRFSELTREKRNSVHYAQALASCFNDDLDLMQQSFFTYKPNDFEVQKAVRKICKDLEIPSEIVERHKIILFEASNDMLLSIRCCTINSALEICESVNLTSFININDIIIVEEVKELNTKVNDSTTTLKFRDKAKKKLNQNDNINIIKPDEGIELNDKLI